MILKFLKLWILLLLQVCSCCGCNLVQVSECTLILNQYAPGIQNSAIPSADDLKMMCSSVVDKFKDCYEPKAASCTNDPVFTMTFGTISKTLDYLCIDGYQHILQHASCWNKTEVTDATIACHEQQNAAIMGLQVQMTNLTQTEVRDGWCNILDNTTSCTLSAVLGSCGETPACIAKMMMKKAFDGLSQLMQCPKTVDCQIDGNSTSGVIDSRSKEPHSVTPEPDSYTTPSVSSALENFTVGQMFTLLILLKTMTVCFITIS